MYNNNSSNHYHSQPQLYKKNLQQYSLGNVKEYLKDYMDSGGRYPDFLAYKKLQQQQNNQDSLQRSRIPGLDRMYQSMDNTMQILREKEGAKNLPKCTGRILTPREVGFHYYEIKLEVQRELGYLGNNSQEYHKKKQLEKELQQLRESGLQQKQNYDLQLPRLQPNNNSQIYQNQLNNMDQNMSYNNDYRQMNDDIRRVLQEHEHTGLKGDLKLGKHYVEPEYKMQDGFTLRLDFIGGLQYNYKSVQVFMEFSLEEDQSFKFSWSQLYPTENDTFNSKRCMPYYANIFKLVPQPRMQLVIECWGYQQKNPLQKDKPIGKAWTKFEVFTDKNRLVTGKFKLPFYAINTNHETNRYVANERYLDNSNINLRICIPNDPELDQNTRKFNQKEYFVPLEHSYEVREREYLVDGEEELENQMYNNRAYSLGYDHSNQKNGKVVKYEDIFPPPQDEYRPSQYQPVKGQAMISPEFREQLKMQEQFQNMQQQHLMMKKQQQQQYAGSDYNDQYFQKQNENQQYYQVETKNKEKYIVEPVEEVESDKLSQSQQSNYTWSSKVQSKRSSQTPSIQSQQQQQDQQSVSQQSGLSKTQEDFDQVSQQSQTISQQSQTDSQGTSQSQREDFKKQLLAVREEEDEDDIKENKVDDSQKALYIDFHYVQDMNDPRSLKYRVKLIGDKNTQQNEQDFLNQEGIRDRNGDICDFKGGLETLKKDKKRRYFEAQECFNVTKEDIVRGKMQIIIELYVFDKQYKPPIYQKFGELSHMLVKQGENKVELMEGKFERPIYQRQKFKMVKSSMELGYTVFRDIYKGDKVYLNNTIMEIKVKNLENFNMEKATQAQKVYMDVAVIMDRDVLEDDEGMKQLYQQKMYGISLIDFKKKQQKSVQVRMDKNYEFDVNIDLDEVRTMNRGNLYLFYIVFIVKMETSADKVDYGWYAHPVFKDMIKFNTGQFQQKLWRPPPILDAPYDPSDYKQQSTMINFEVNYAVRLDGNRRQSRVDPLQKIEDKLRRKKESEIERMRVLGLQNRYAQINIKSIDKMDHLITDFNIQCLVMNDQFIIQDQNQEELAMEFQDLKPDGKGKAEVNDEFRIMIEYKLLRNMNRQKKIFFIANVVKNEEVILWTIVPLFKQGEIADGERQIQRFFYPPVQKISDFNPNKLRKSNTLVKFTITVEDSFGDLE